MKMTTASKSLNYCTVLILFILGACAAKTNNDYIADYLKNLKTNKVYVAAFLDNGSWVSSSWASAHRTIEDARKAALGACNDAISNRGSNAYCRVVYENDILVDTPKARENEKLAAATSAESLILKVQTYEVGKTTLNDFLNDFELPPDSSPFSGIDNVSSKGWKILGVNFTATRSIAQGGMTTSAEVVHIGIPRKYIARLTFGGGLLILKELK